MLGFGIQWLSKWIDSTLVILRELKETRLAKHTLAVGDIMDAPKMHECYSPMLGESEATAKWISALTRIDAAEEYALCLDIPTTIIVLVKRTTDSLWHKYEVSVSSEYVACAVPVVSDHG